jgi:hypothetical protein
MGARNKEYVSWFVPALAGALNKEYMFWVVCGGCTYNSESNVESSDVGSWKSSFCSDSPTMEDAKPG